MDLCQAMHSLKNSNESALLDEFAQSVNSPKLEEEPQRQIYIGSGHAPVSPSLKFQERSIDNSQKTTEVKQNLLLGEVKIIGARNTASPSRNSDYRDND